MPATAPSGHDIQNPPSESKGALSPYLEMVDRSRPKQIARLVRACEGLSAYFAMDACRIIYEWPDDANLVPYLENLPVKVVREFDEAIGDILDGVNESVCEQNELLAKYEAALAEMRKAGA